MMTEEELQTARIEVAQNASVMAAFFWALRAEDVPEDVSGQITSAWVGAMMLGNEPRRRPR